MSDLRTSAAAQFETMERIARRVAGRRPEAVTGQSVVADPVAVVRVGAFDDWLIRYQASGGTLPDLTR